MSIFSKTLIKIKEYIEFHLYLYLKNMIMSMRKLIWSISYTHVKKITKFYTRKYIFSYES